MAYLIRWQGYADVLDVGLSCRGDGLGSAVLGSAVLERYCLVKEWLAVLKEAVCL